jgi:plastocyanin
MNARSANASKCVTACTVLALLCFQASAAELSVTVSTAAAAGLAGAVVVAEPVHATARPRAGLKAIMDQKDLQFVPNVLVVQTGTAVDFPNSDQVRHQVYSFSGAKTFQLSLYAGRTHPPVIFDKAGLVTLGCNIHDGMIGYVYITDSPWYGLTDEGGQLQLRELPPGEYTIHVWHPRMHESSPQLERRVTLAEGTTVAAFQMQQPLRSPPHQHGMDKMWADY